MIFIINAFSWALILAGGFFLLTGAIGVMRMPDFYTRLHASGLTDTMGSTLLVGGLMLQAGFGIVTLKLALILIFVYFTSPIATHALANAAYAAKLRMHPLTDQTGPKKETQVQP